MSKRRPRTRGNIAFLACASLLAAPRRIRRHEQYPRLRHAGLQHPQRTARYFRQAKHFVTGQPRQSGRRATAGNLRYRSFQLQSDHGNRASLSVGDESAATIARNGDSHWRADAVLWTRNDIGFDTASDSPDPMNLAVRAVRYDGRAGCWNRDRGNLTQF